MTTLSLPEIRDVSSAMRPLGALEHLFLLLDKNNPVHFAMTAEISGPTGVDDWRRALDRVQKRHSMLSTTIGGALGSAPWLRKADDFSIPLRVIYDDPSERWMTEVSAELANPFDLNRSPLVRAILVHASGRATISLIAHPSIADGMSLAYLLRDTLRALSGTPLAVLPARPAMEDIFREKGLDDAVDHTESAAAEPPQVVPGVWRKANGSRPEIHRLRLSSGLTADLKERAKAEAATVHAALCAALSIVGRRGAPNWEDIPVRILSPVNIRSMLGVGEDCGVFVGAALGVADATESDFWSIARKIKADIAPSQTPQGVGGLIGQIEQFVDGGPSVADTADFAATAFAAEAMITNLGVLPFESQFPSLEIQAVWGPCVLRGFEADHTIGVATVNGCLCLAHTTFAASEGLLEGMEEVLEVASRV